jgi:hypothetical protein
MTLHAYINKRISAERMELIEEANKIIEEYQLEGYSITLRQLYYQFVSRNLLENSKKSYQRLCALMKDARMVGLIDWDAIVDRTRNLETRARWSSPQSIIDTCADGFHVHLWEGQKNRVEVWIEKDALVSVIEDTCYDLDCPFLACRGYNSASEMREAALRITKASQFGCHYTILYAGDHDPSGSDMSEDIRKRLKQFRARFDFHRIALNMEQIEQFKLPPNKIKDSDSRSKKYQQRFGSECWELDALPPSELIRIISESIRSFIDNLRAFDARLDEAEQGRKILRAFADNYTDLADLVKPTGSPT